MEISRQQVPRVGDVRNVLVNRGRNEAKLVEKERLEKIDRARMRRRKRERESTDEADRSCQKRVAARLRAWPHPSI